MIVSIASLLLWPATLMAKYMMIAVALVFCWRFGRRKLLGHKKRPVSSSEAVLITGATSGFGLATAKHLHKLGYSVIAAYVDASEAGHSELKQLFATGSGHKNKLLMLEMDVRSRDSIEKAYETTNKWLRQEHLKLAGLINNAGLGSLQPFAWLQKQRLSDLVDTNIKGTLLVAREFLPLLVEARGRLVNVASGLGLVPGANYATYGLTKAAQIYLTESLNMEFGRLGVECVVVIPHNFIKSTNIITTNARLSELGWQELRPEERKLYESEYHEHNKMIKQLEAAAQLDKDEREASKAKRKAAAAYGGARRSPPEVPQCPLGKAMHYARLVLNAPFEGSPSIEESGILQCFEDAIRLERPPEHLFAGDLVFDYVMGSVLMTVPKFCVRLISKSVTKSLYK